MSLPVVLVILTEVYKFKSISFSLTTFRVLASNSLILILVVNVELNAPGEAPHRLTDELSSALGSMYLLVTVMFSDTD